jgi:hypothetical protein
VKTKGQQPNELGGSMKVSFPRLSGVQMFALFLLLTMLIFTTVSFFVLRIQSEDSLVQLENENTKVKIAAAERYMLQYLNNAQVLSENLARHQIVTSTILGSSATAQQIQDRIQAFKPLTGQHYIVLMDIAEEIIYQERSLSDEATAFLVAQVETESKKTQFLMFNHNKQDMLLVTVPVLYNDFFEGTMGYLTPFDADVFFCAAAS